MLRLLRIRNFAIIDELELEFHGGFNAITGETGAGKSIILDAISLVLGNRANADLIRSGSDEATVEALFDVGANDAFLQKLTKQGLNIDDQEIIIKRTVHRNGKNKIFLNGELVTLAQLGEVCENLVELCSQHEHQSLSKTSFQLDLIDRYGGLFEKRREIRELYSGLRSSESELRALLGGDREHARTEDFLRFQAAEIDEFNPRDGEEEALIQERRRLLNATNLIETINQALAFIEQEDESVRNLLSRASQRVSKSLALDEGLRPAADAIERALLEVDEASTQLSSYADGLEADPARLETVEARLTKLAELKRKYGATVAEIKATREDLENELNEIANRSGRVKELEDQIAEVKRDYQKLAGDLSKKRKNVAKTLTKTIQQELAELSMAGTRFDVEFSMLEGHDGQLQAGPDGVDRVHFLFSPNAGEELKPVNKIASGGELSRVMLAIRRTIADRGNIGVYLFDEIDAGIGGQTATIVGKKLQSVAKYNQVICITHLPQVAAFASAHYSVNKKVSAGRTLSSIEPLEGSKRVDELARMLGGMNVTDKSRAHAKDLLKQASL